VTTISSFPGGLTVLFFLWFAGANYRFSTLVNYFASGRSLVLVVEDLVAYR
jgi:hypothetical protein